MSIAAMITGELTADPVRRQTQKGGPFMTANLRVHAGEPVYVSVATFSETTIAVLAGLHKGDQIAVGGTMEVNRWTDQREGTERSGWRINATTAMSLYELGKRKKVATGDDQDGQRSEPARRPDPAPAARSRDEFEPGADDVPF